MARFYVRNLICDILTDLSYSDDWEPGTLYSGRVTRSASPQRSRCTGPSSFPPSCTVQRPGFSIGSRSGYWSGFTNASCAPSLESHGKTTCQTKKSSREQAAQHRVNLASGAAALGWPRHKDGRRTHAHSSLLQQASRRKARSRRPKKCVTKIS